MENPKKQLLQKVEKKSDAAIRLYNLIQERLVAEEIDLVYFLWSAGRFPPGSPGFNDQTARANQKRQAVIDDTKLLEIIKEKVMTHLAFEGNSTN